MPDTREEKFQTLMMKIYKMVECFNGQISGKTQTEINLGSDGFLYNGFGIKNLMYALYKDLGRSEIAQEYSDKDIERAVMMHEGDSVPGFPSVDLLIYLLQPLLTKLQYPAIELVQDVYFYLERIATHLVN